MALGPSNVAIRQRHLEVLGDRQVVEQVVTLKDESNVLTTERLAVLRLELMHRLTDELELTLPRRVVHAEDM